MNTTVKATETRSINVTLSEEEAFKAICNMLHVDYLIRWNDDSKTRWTEKLESFTNKLVSLIEEEDISYHGTSNWKPTGRIEDDRNILINYKIAKELRARLKREKRGEDLQARRGIVRRN